MNIMLISSPYGLLNIMSSTTKQTIHLFGEMDLPINGNIKAIVSKAERIAEACGYSVLVFKNDNFIEIYGEDSADSIAIVSRIRYSPETQKITKIVKRVLTADATGNFTILLKEILLFGS